MPCLRFERFELRADERVLLMDGVPVPLRGRAFDLLCALVQHRDRVLGKAELMDMVWPGLVVEENNLSVQVSGLRKLLGASAISTVPSYGYRFTRPVMEVLPDAPPPLHGIGLTTAPVEAHPPTVDAVDELLRRAAQRQRVLLGLRPGADAGLWSETTVPLACAQVAAWGGQLQQADAQGLVAVFPEAHLAQACVQGLRLGLQRQQLGPQAVAAGVVQLGDDQPQAAAQAALRLADLAGPGGIRLSVEASAQLVVNLDGEPPAATGEHARNVLSLVTPSPALSPAAPPLSLVPAVPLAAPTAVAAQRLHPTLAVIPFRPYVSAHAPIALGDVLADQVISALSRSAALNVISRLSTAPFRDLDQPADRVGARLAADFIVSGRYLQSAGDSQVQVHVELARATDGHVLWTQQLSDSTLAVLQPDSLLVQELVLGITRAVLVSELRQVRSQPLPTLASHTLLLAAISLLYRLAPRDFGLAQEALLLLRERAPRHAEPLAWLARWHLFRVVQGWSGDRQADGQQALECAQRALDLDPDSSLALTMLGNVHTSHLRDLDRASTLYDQALALNPNESLAWLQKGNACSFRGEGEAALAHASKAVSLSPLDPSRHYYQSILASAALSAHDYPRAIAAARESLRQNHEHVSTHRVLAIALSLSGRLDEARASVGEVLRLEPGLTVAGFVARSPGARSGLAHTFGQALLAAGLPPGEGGLH